MGDKVHFIDNRIIFRIRPSIEGEGGLAGGCIEPAMVQIQGSVGIPDAGCMTKDISLGNSLADSAVEISRHMVGGIKARPSQVLNHRRADTLKHREGRDDDLQGFAVRVLPEAIVSLFITFFLHNFFGFLWIVGIRIVCAKQV